MANNRLFGLTQRTSYELPSLALSSSSPRRMSSPYPHETPDTNNPSTPTKSRQPAAAHTGTETPLQ